MSSFFLKKEKKKCIVLVCRHSSHLNHTNSPYGLFLQSLLECPAGAVTSQAATTPKLTASPRLPLGLGALPSTAQGLSTRCCFLSFVGMPWFLLPALKKEKKKRKKKCKVCPDTCEHFSKTLRL